jgi:4-hydroxybutyrate dehydrogenase
MTPALQIPRAYFAEGAIGELPNELSALGVSRPLLVTDAGLVKCGVFGMVTAKLGTAAINYAVFDAVPENPTYEGVDRAATACRAQQCDGVVAVGGGSVIDTAKLTAVLAGHAGRASDYVGHSERVTAATVPLIVIPTTAGTGSEASPDAGIHPDAHTISSGITSRHVIPKVAICDPKATVSMPSGLTAATGLDALSHCVEGYLSTSFCPPADALALDGIRRVFRYLPKATKDGNDLNARMQMMIAAFAGGVAIGKGLGPAHAIAISCGDRGLHHGLLSAIGLLASMPVMERECPERMRAIGNAIEPAEYERPSDAVRALMISLGLPTSLAAVGYQAGDISELARRAAMSHFNLTSPYVPIEAEFGRMIEMVLD